MVDRRDRGPVRHASQRWSAAVATVIVLAGCGSSVPGTSAGTASSSTAATTVAETTTSTSSTTSSSTTTTTSTSTTTTSTTTTSTTTASTSTTTGTTTTAVPADPDQTLLAVLAGRQFQGDGPVAPVRFRIEADGTFSASYGCNGGGGTAAIVDGHLVVQGISKTERSCLPALMEQDDAVVTMLQANPAITIRGTTLTLAGTTLTLQLEEQFPVALIGTPWTTNGTVSPQVATFSGLRQGFVLAADGTWTYDGCGGTSTGRYTVTGDAIAFTTTSPTPPPCAASTEQADEEHHLLALLQGTATFRIAERTLQLTGPDDAGEMFIAM